MDTLIRDIRYGSRILLKNPGFTLIAVVALALGIGANTAIFSVVNSVLLRPLPYADPDRLVQLREVKLPEHPDFSVTPATFLEWQKQSTAFMNLIVRSDRDPSNLTVAIRGEVLALDREQPIARVQTLETIVATSVAQQRFAMILMGLFALVAFVLAAVGLYGVMSYSVAQRTHEIGIRMALGAKQSDVLRMVVGQGAALALAGVALGLGAAIAVTRLMASLLFEVTATDPLTFSVIAVLLAAVALAASFIPARRATRVDPMVALRNE
ncbi:MAG: FtsX-like permease family protein [Blastocatellia bacterium]